MLFIITYYYFLIYFYFWYTVIIEIFTMSLILLSFNAIILSKINTNAKRNNTKCNYRKLKKNNTRKRRA